MNDDSSFERCAKKQRLALSDDASFEETFSGSTQRSKLDPMPDVLPQKSRTEASNIVTPPSTNEIAAPPDDSLTSQHQQQQQQSLTSSIGSFHFPFSYGATSPPLPPHIPTDPTPTNPFNLPNHVTSQLTSGFASHPQENGDQPLPSHQHSAPPSSHHAMTYSAHSANPYQSPFGTSTS